MDKFTLGVTDSFKESLYQKLAALPHCGELIRSYKGRKVYEVEIEGKPYIVKCYEVNGLKEKLRAAFKYSQGDRSYRGAFDLKAAGVDTPEALALVREGCLSSRKNFLITEKVSDGLEPLDYLNKQREAFERLAEKTSDIVKRCLRAKITHGDLHQQNFLVTPDERLIVIDLDSLKSHWMGIGLTNRHARDRQRLLNSVKMNSDYYEELCKNLLRKIL